MSRRIQTLRTPIALAAVSILLASCSDNAADAEDETADTRSSSSTPAEEGSTPAEESSTPAEESSAPADEVVLPEGVLPLPALGPDGEDAPLDAGRYHVPLSDTLAFEVDLPQGTFAYGDGLYLERKGSVLKVEVAGEAYGVPNDPCNDPDDLAPAGPTVADLVEAIRNQPAFQVSRPEPTELDGASGKSLDVRIRATYDATRCRDGQVGLPGNPGTNNNVTPAYTGQWQILDVAGQRVVVQHVCDGCTASASERLVSAARTITFTAAP